MNYDSLKEFARKIVLKGVEYEHLFDVLCDLGLFRIETMDTNRNRVPATEIVMETLHELHSENPNLQIDKKTYDTLAYMFGQCKGIRPIELGIKEVEWQLHAQKENRVSFQLDCKSLIDLLKKNLKDNKEIYKEKVYIEEGFPQFIEEHDQYLYKNYRIRIR